MKNNKSLENPDVYQDKMTSRDQQYIHKDDVLKEVDEEHEEEKIGETPKDKKPESETSSRLKDEIPQVEPESDKKADSVEESKKAEEIRKQASNDIDIRIDDNW